MPGRIRVPESDMVMLTLSLLGGLAVAPYLTRSARGSAKKRLSPLQKRLLYLTKMLPSDPEAVLRTQDLVIATLRGGGSLPGLDTPVERLLQDIRDPGLKDVATGWRQGLGGTVESTLHEYVALTNEQIANNEHFGQFGRAGNRVVQLERRSRYDKLIPWLGMQVRQLLQQARAGTLTVRPARGRAVYFPGPRIPSAPDRRRYWEARVGDQEVEVFRRLGIMRRHLSSVADWVEATSPLLTGGRDQAGRKIAPVTWSQATYRASRWHKGLEAGRPAQITPGTVVYTGSDGWTVQQLDKRICLVEEGKALAHCVGGHGYWSGVERGDLMIFSLRMPNGAPVVTIEVTILDPETEAADHSSFRVVQAKGRRDRLLGTKKSQIVTECLHVRAWLEELFGRGVRPADIVRDLVPCQAILLRITGWDRIDQIPVGQTPEPMPTQAEYKTAMKKLADQRRRGGGQARQSGGSAAMTRPPPIYSLQRARRARRLLERLLAQVATAATEGPELSEAQRIRMADIAHQALLVLDGYLIGRQTGEGTTRHLRQAATRSLVEYNADELAYLSDDGYSRIVLNLVRLDDSQPWLYLASESLPETKRRWATLQQSEAR